MKKAFFLPFLFILFIQAQAQGIIITITTTDESCNPGGDGSASALVSGGMAPYSYFWSAGAATTPLITGLSAGTYFVTVTDANARMQTAAATINSAQGPNTTSVIVGPTCPGSADGIISLSTTGGNPPFTYLWSNSQSSPNLAGLNAGTYTVTVIDQLGCTTVNTFIMTAPPPIINTVTQNGLLLTADQPNANYQWLDCVNSFTTIANAIGQSFTAPLNGFWAVEITVNGCADTSSCISTFTIGLNEDKNQQEAFRMYPNPSRGLLNLELSKSLLGQQLRILNISGQVVYQSTLMNSQLKIDLAHLPKGLYFIHLKEEKRKLVLSH